MKALISFYMALFLRRLHYFLIVFLTITAASITLAKLLPPSYVSEARLLVEPPQIPGQLLAPTVQVEPEEELQIIEQQLLTRSNLLEIARSQNVFENIEEMTPDEIVRRMRSDTNIRRIAGRRQATLMFLSFESKNPKTTADVVNQYVTKILQNNAETRTERATNTLEFFKGEVERLGTRLQQQSARITQFKNDNIDALPDTLNYRLSEQSTLQERLATIDRQLFSLEEQRKSVIDVFERTGQVGTAAGTPISREQEALNELQDSLRQALAIYSPENPRVKMIKAQIAQQEEIVASQVGTTTDDANAETSLLDINLAGIDAQIRLLETQREQLTRQLAALKETLERTPANSIKLDSLERDYQNTQAQYNAAVASLSQASMGERIEVLSQGQRIVVLDPATVPTRPDGPNRKLIAVGGTLFGAMLGIGLIILLEFFNNSIRRPADITKHLGIDPIATVPYVRTPMELVFRRAGFVAVILAIIVGLPAAIYAVHNYFMPLDLIYERFAQKIGGLI